MHQPGRALDDLREAAFGAAPSLLLGLIGSGIQASRTPSMHEREAAHHGLRAIYKLIDLDVLGLDGSALPDLLTAAERMGFAGLNITHPCKQAVVPLLHELSPSATAIGAVNTVVFSGGRRIGHNTDAYGFAESFRRKLGAAPKARVVMLGAGGAGAAVGYALLECGTGRLSIFDVDAARAETLAIRLAKRFGADRVAPVADLEEAVAGAEGLVNTTPIGMAAHPGSPLPPGLLRSRLWVADVIYFPAETELLRAARGLGCPNMSGAGMALFQAVEAFRLFTGLTPEPERMRRHFREM